MDLKYIKNNYSLVEKKFSLPAFDDINILFEIEKMACESDCFVRSVRKIMMEKIVNSLNFFEMLLNSVNAPRLYMPFLKTMTADDRKRLEKLYEKFGQISLDCMSLELNYSEKAEAEMIKRIYNLWIGSKRDFTYLLNKIAHPSSQNIVRKEKSYFG